jgi:hypothetical protein
MESQSSDDSSLLNELLSNSNDKFFEWQEGDDEEENEGENEFMKITFDDDDDDEDDSDINSIEKVQVIPISNIKIKSLTKFKSLSHHRFKHLPHRRIVKFYKKQAQRKKSVKLMKMKKLQKHDDEENTITQDPIAEEINIPSNDLNCNEISKSRIEDNTTVNVPNSISNGSLGCLRLSTDSNDDEELFEFEDNVDEIDELEEHDVRLISDDSLSEMELEEEIGELPPFEDPKPIKYSIPQNLLAKNDIIAKNQQKGRQTYVEKMMKKNGGKGLNLTKLETKEMFTNKPTQSKLVSSSRRKALHVPKVDLDESNLFTNSGLTSIPKRPSDNIELIECLSSYRVLAKKLLEKINIPEMDLTSNTDDLINVYKLLRN